jgi:hypothetical protein
MDKQKLKQNRFGSSKHTWSARSDWPIEILSKSPWAITSIVVVVGHRDRVEKMYRIKAVGWRT